MVQLLSELAVDIFIYLLVLTIQEARLRTQPIGHIGAFLGDHSHFEATLGEDLVGVKGFSDEQTCGIAIVERSSGGGDCDDGAAGKRHLAAAVEYSSDRGPGS